MPQQLRTLSFLLLSMFGSMLAQSFVTRGTDFWLAFPSNTSGTANLRINIASDATTTGNISSGIGWSTGFTVTAGGMTTITVPNTHMVTAYEVIENKGIHIVSLDTVTINASWVESGGGDAILVYPTPCIGSSYVTVGFYNLNPSALVITAIQNGTSVTITPRAATTMGRPAGTPFSITLNAGQTYRVGANAEFNGTIITSSAPISVASTNHCSQVPTGTTYCDMIWEQLLPTSYLGKYFVTGYMEGRTPDIDVFRVVAVSGGSNIYVNGTLVTTLAAGAYYETSLSNGNIISSNNDIIVAQFSRGSSAHGGNGDPCMVWVPPTALYSKRYFFNTMEAGVITSHWITIYTKSANIGLARLDGALIPVAGWNSIAGSPWSYKVISVATGLHTLSSDSSICGISYGWGGVTSYGYPMGGSFTPIVLSERSLNLFGWYSEGLASVLQWNCAEVVSDHYFRIERSTDGSNWIGIHEMTNVAGTIWQYEDRSITPGQTYRYRIVGRDKNGMESYSEAITIRTLSDLAWDVYPSIFSQEVHLDLTLNNQEWIEFSLINAIGQQVFSNQLLGQPGTQTFHFSVPSSLPSGTYHAIVKTANERFSQTIQKQ